MTSEKGFTYFIWENKIFLSIILIILIGVLSFVQNGSLLVFVVALLFSLIAIKRGSFKEIGLRKPESWKKTIIWGIILGVIIEMLSLVFLEPILELITDTPFDYSQFDSMRGNLPTLLIWIAAGWVIGGFLEEISFRGFMITRIQKVIGSSNTAVVVALLLTAIPFGLAHTYQGLSGIISTGLTGLVLGIIYVRNGYNLWLPIITHGVIDTVGLVLMYFSYDIAIGDWVKGIIA